MELPVFTTVTRSSGMRNSRGYLGSAGRRCRSGRNSGVRSRARRKPMLAMNHRPVADDGRDRVLENQLLLAVVLKQDRIFVEGTDLSRQLYSANQIDRYRSFIFADRI